ncbi:MAG: ribose-phosphate pyrophosphokinase [Candidatus Woesearchaeota archaeon]|jgi:ribose-phosphate pyrophosphokinase|nr:ribose-phosphate pyrophosphokinase [Candidatus Woesearchaeota archaeon]MDP6265933.1 ribose-phosphate pyrophosphokinase [Candidatus Woesearchaeota archaeon]MDP7476330.1 ribose-phosphate pyrophosphokinase [Candidatus Woesearchaeota archaeon]HJO02260.1 ribose-phosphate pyrophosphokinase [Candidatus Woesearchaeota archaeon]|tara:strand:- start:1555 stop:2526 length:972 start_codon:yes stop_codon:yes gene_type:complete
MEGKFKLISGNANKSLALEVAKHLNVKLTPADIHQFNDGEIYVRILESVRGCNVFIIQPTSPDANLHLMELLIMVDALKRASPKRITAVMPYFGYSRQDRKTKPREPITAKLVAKLLEAAGVDRVMTFELHVPQVQGFFDIPSDNLDLIPLHVENILNKKLKEVVIVAPDVGSAARARSLARVIHAPIAIVDKRRPEQGIAKVEHIMGDVKNKTALLVDDIIDTAGTITESVSMLKKYGAKDIYVLATHPVLSGPAIKRLQKSPIKEIFVTNTIELPKEKQIKKIKIISIAPLLSETIKRAHEGAPMGIVYEKLYEKLKKRNK